MEKFIKDINSYNVNDIMNDQWDIIDLNLTFDVKVMKEWYNIMNKEFSSSKFIMCPSYYEKYFQPNFVRRYSVADYSIPNKDMEYTFNWTLNWPVERYDPLPFPHLANRELYPEIINRDFDERNAPFLSKFQFGGFKIICDKMKKYMQKTRLLTLPSGSRVVLHHDIDPGELLFKLHFQIETNHESSWFFGYDASREYVLEEGKVYLVNTSSVHGAINTGNSPWTMIHTSPDMIHIDEILKLKGKLF